MQRQMIAELRHGDMDEQRRTRTPLLDRQRRHRRLDDGLARPAAHLRPHVHDALEVGGNVFEHLALVRADPAELVAAASRAHARRFVDDRLRRQMVGQGSAVRRLALLLRRGAGLGRLGRVRLRRPRASVSATPASISSISGSSCSTCASSFSDLRPKRARRRTASWARSFSIISALAWTSALSHATSRRRSSAKRRRSSGSRGESGVDGDMTTPTTIAPPAQPQSLGVA